MIYTGPDGTWAPRWVCDAWLKAWTAYLGGAPYPGGMCQRCGVRGGHRCVFSIRQVDPTSRPKHPAGHHGMCVTNPKRPCLMGGLRACARCICRPLRERLIVVVPQEAV